MKKEVAPMISALTASGSLLGSKNMESSIPSSSSKMYRWGDHFVPPRILSDDGWPVWTPVVVLFTVIRNESRRLSDFSLFNIDADDEASSGPANSR
mgnify:CR=1 FL=1